MTEPIFDHDRLDVYRLAVQYTAESFRVAKGLSGLHRHVRDQWLRAAPFIPLNVAEVNGKRSPNDRARFLDIARGSALECAAIQDVLVASGGLDAESSRSLKGRLQRIVSMLTRMAMKGDGVGESQAEYCELVDDEHRFAEHEHRAEYRSGARTIGWTEAAFRSSGLVGVFCRRSVTLVVRRDWPESSLLASESLRLPGHERLPFGNPSYKRSNVISNAFPMISCFNLCPRRRKV
jgi:four helix bundle protein